MIRRTDLILISDGDSTVGGPIRARLDDDGDVVLEQSGESIVVSRADIVEFCRLLQEWAAGE